MSFAKTLKQLRKKANTSIYQLWKFSGVDQSYIAKLEKGDKLNPSRSTVLLLGMALVHVSGAIDVTDIDELLWEAELAPLRKRDIAHEAKRRPQN